MISLYFIVSVAPFEFFPLKLTVEPDVTVDPKCQDQISGRLLKEGGRLGTSPDMVNPLLSLQGGYSLQERLRGRRDLLN